MAETLRGRAAHALPLIAFGAIAGVSFLAQPAKFLTPDLTLAQLVSVGSTLFDASHGFQLAVLLLLLAVVPGTKARPPTAWALLGVFALALCFQQFGLMPPLEARLMQLKQGLQPAPSLLHASYIALELLKLACLLALAWMGPKPVPGRSPEPVGATP
jgi:hypothetical protein